MEFVESKCSMIKIGLWNRSRVERYSVAMNLFDVGCGKSVEHQLLLLKAEGCPLSSFQDGKIAPNQ